MFSLFHLERKGALKNENYGKSCQQEQRMSTLSVLRNVTSEYFSVTSSFLFWGEVAPCYFDALNVRGDRKRSFHNFPEVEDFFIHEGYHMRN